MTATHPSTRVPIFDLDGTLIDSDAALLAAFVALGIPAETVTFGHVLADECGRLGLDVDDYLAAYDASLARPFAGVTELVAGLDRWAVCSNKDLRTAELELERLGWQPDVAMFADSFGGPKRLGPVLDALDLGPERVVFVGDTDHDRSCASGAGVPFLLAGWNPRAAPLVQTGDIVLREPADVLDHLHG